MLPDLHAVLLEPLIATVPNAALYEGKSLQEASPSDPSTLLDSLHVMTNVVGHMDSYVAELHVAPVLPRLGALLVVPDLGIQAAAADVMAATAAALPTTHLPPAIAIAVQLLHGGAPDDARIGGMVATSKLLTKL